MTGLQEFDASDNSLVGSLPPQWSKLTGLSMLRVCCNDFDGSMPQVGEPSRQRMSRFGSG
eukprot:365058-Chlamydomonas_euryale.AAC.2